MSEQKQNSANNLDKNLKMKFGHSQIIAQLKEWKNRLEKTFETDKRVMPALLVLFLVCAMIIFAIGFSRENPISKTEPESSTDLIPTMESDQLEPSLTPTIVVASPTVKPTLKISPTTANLPSPTPVSTNTPTPKPTSTPVPQTPNPPIIDITYPTSMQSIEMSSDQNFCLVDVPTGGDTSGLQRRHNLNDQGWTEYVGMYTLCLDPAEGLNTLHLQYRNQYGEESAQYTRQFTFHRL